MCLGSGSRLFLLATSLLPAPGVAGSAEAARDGGAAAEGAEAARGGCWLPPAADVAAGGRKGRWGAAALARRRCSADAGAGAGAGAVERLAGFKGRGGNT